jgi:CRISPR-associated exonuclease Cas4
MLDGNPYMFRVTDLKQFQYCKRVLFYAACLPTIRPITDKMQSSMHRHDTEQKRAVRRSLIQFDVEGERRFDVPVQSAALQLSGQIDEVIEVRAPSAELIPVDYKLSRQVGTHFKVQLAAYALMLEETYGVAVKRGLIYLIPLKRHETVPITRSLRNSVHQALQEMHQMVDKEQMPPPADHLNQCVNCEFRRFCNDVI